MRLLSYNIHKGIGGRDRRYNLDRVIAVIESENPDFLCLQEVDRNVARSRNEDQPRRLAEALNSEGVLFQMNVHVQSGGYGNLLLSRWPFRAHHQFSLRLGARKPRGAQMAVIESPEGAFRLVNWHLGLAEVERVWQVHHLLDHRLFREHGDLPTLIAGDTNDWRERLGGNAFARHGYRQVTVPRSRFRTFPAYLAVGALDKVFRTHDVEVRRAHVVRSPLAKVASDHLPLVVDFHLAPSASTASQADP